MDAPNDDHLSAIFDRLDALRSEADRLSEVLDSLGVRHWMQGNEHADGATIVLDDVGVRRLRSLAEELRESGKY